MLYEQFTAISDDRRYVKQIIQYKTSKFIISMTDKSIDLEEKGIEFLKINRYEIEENVVFISYEPEQILKTIETYKTLKIFHRVSLAKNIRGLEEACDDAEAIGKLLILFATDCEDVQRELIIFLGQAIHQEIPRNDYQRYLVQPLISMINGIHLQIKQQSCTLLSEASKYLSVKEKRDIIKFAMDLGKSEDEENKIVSIQLIAKMTPDLPQEETESFFKNEYVNLYKDSSVRIKKEIVASTCIIGNSVRKEFLNKEIIQCFFIEKCKESVWGVRKACVEILSKLVQMTDTKKELLAQTLINFTKDGNKIVKISAFKIIPEFIANYNSQKVPQKLVDIFLHLIDHEINQSVSRQNEILIKVSFYFPGVMQTLGVSKWDQMKKLFNRLILFKNQDVKLPLASSLHEISRIIGPELSKEYMFSALDTILKDNSDFLKLSAIEHLSQFVELFQKGTRQNLIDVFLVLQKDPKKWRVRYSISHQLKALSKIYQNQIVFKYIFPISLKLCNDNVSQVREEAAYQMYYVIESLKENELLQEMALESIKGYGLSEKYIQRQTFARMVRNIYKINNFAQKFMDLVIEIAKDKIVIIRITLAISINQIIKQNEQNRNLFDKVIQLLVKDEQEDVNLYFQ